MVQLRARKMAGDRVVIEVEDSCGGLPPGRAEELFSPFVQTASDRTGLGLGLTIARRAAVRLGGQLTVQDLPGKGCVFTLDLPVNVEASVAEVPQAPDGVPAAAV